MSMPASPVVQGCPGPVGSKGFAVSAAAGAGSGCALPDGAAGASLVGAAGVASERVKSTMSDPPELESLIRVEVAGFVSFVFEPPAELVDWATATVPQPATAAASAMPETVWRREIRMLFVACAYGATRMLSCNCIFSGSSPRKTRVTLSPFWSSGRSKTITPCVVPLAGARRTPSSV
jgi:hypothetical protein